MKALLILRYSATDSALGEECAGAFGERFTGKGFIDDDKLRSRSRDDLNMVAGELAGCILRKILDKEGFMEDFEYSL